MNQILSALFGCFHRRQTFPITRWNQTYVVCLDCGKEFDYDWKAMQVGARIERAAPVERLATK